MTFEEELAALILAELVKRNWNEPVCTCGAIVLDRDKSHEVMVEATNKVVEMAMNFELCAMDPDARLHASGPASGNKHLH